MTFSTFATASLALAATLFGTTVRGHLIMANPIPFGKDTLNNSPLVDAAPGSTGSDFPCKQRTGVYDITAMNNMAVGDSIELSFTGSASHGGGTCMLSVTTDLEPTYKSTWKIIQVFEGGCPIDADGNDGTHPFTFTIPKGMKNGRLTLSWSWYNRIGNREIYQNCAPIDVTGGSDSLDVYNSLPNAYFINLPSTDCSTPESEDVIIPFPGQFVMSADSSSLASASGSGCAASAAAQTSGVSGYKSAVSNDGAAYSAPAKDADVTGPATGAASQTADASSSQQTSTQAAMTSASATAASPSGGEIGNSATSGGASASNTGLVTLSTTSAAASSAYPTQSASSDAGVAAASGGASAAGAASPSGTTGTSSGGSTGTGTCSNDGALVCNGPNLFAICNAGSAVWQPVAAGTTCSNGQIAKRSVLRHAHVRRHVQNAPKVAALWDEGTDGF